MGEPNMRRRPPRTRGSTRVHEHVEQRHQRVVATRLLPRDGRAALHEGHVGDDRHVSRDARRDVARVVSRAAGEARAGAASDGRCYGGGEEVDDGRGGREEREEPCGLEPSQPGERVRSVMSTLKVRRCVECIAIDCFFLNREVLIVDCLQISVSPVAPVLTL